jgi:hypothetical protein
VKSLLAAAALAVAAAYSFWYWFKAWRENRVVADTPTSRVRSAAQGYVELSGRGLMMPNSENRGPLTGQPCTWWRYKIEERNSTGRSRSWTSVQSGTSELPFLLDDDTGQCVVDPRGAEVFANATSVWYGPNAWPEICIPNGPGVFGWLVDHLVTDRYRYTEYRLQPREQVCALGAFGSLGGVGTQDSEVATAELLRTWKRDQTQLLARFDSNHDGVLSSQEWDRARAAARDKVQRDTLSQAPTAVLHTLSHPADGRVFLLAASDGETLARRLRRKALAGIAAFLGSTAALAWTLTRVW